MCEQSWLLCGEGWWIKEKRGEYTLLVCGARMLHPLRMVLLLLMCLWMQHWERSGLLAKCGTFQGCKVKPPVMSGSNETDSNELSRDGSLASASQTKKCHPHLCLPSHAAGFYSWTSFLAKIKSFGHSICMGFLIRRTHPKHGHLSLINMAGDRD